LFTDKTNAIDRLESDEDGPKGFLPSSRYTSESQHDPEDMPAEISSDLEMGAEVDGRTVWTYTASSSTASFHVPLEIRGSPVVIPVLFRYPLRNPIAPPPDPHPHFISALNTLSVDDIEDIFGAYEDALGFYVLTNGWLQIIVPDDFDYAHALSHRPSQFGGLRISYIPQMLTPTADKSETTNSMTTVSASMSPEEDPRNEEGGHWVRSTRSPSSTSRLGSSNSRPGISIGSRARVTIDGSNFKERVEGAIGVATMTECRHFLTVPTHLITEAMKLAKHSLSLVDLMQEKKVRLAAGSQDVGTCLKSQYERNIRF
jgi:hypothetical protein